MTMNKLIEQNRKKIQALARNRGITNVRLFGSMARDDATAESDVDLLVELGEGLSGLALGGFLNDVSDVLKRRVDVVTEGALNPLIREKVINEAIPL